ncbi:MAG: prepilin-type N-terminal cleavage/methylation domain-containing protein [Armatimonadota bacterium]|nr:prepilin-type N-terminal cleavage/methylation domain-containing protein [Armatimonadota bacterium]MDR7450431.1 prepilin-type N-terminal cleavage/methylation domain-containing protein [Armatimonadota bacterium]MDR7466986.1 prepilin-type N-terminal cleavage/methylation domain-containing protein [Armatimonadota bacterium]MDR7493472.1 prepilin-type N-terminal cleavage/methylation domain-containing protein [Armatimonadota bacterium]MDR7498737.1 prepilin-type N-terminal cleavage/methylation domain
MREGPITTRRQFLQGQTGFTLIELLVATAIFGIVAIFLLTSFIQALSQAGYSNERSAATTIGMQVMEQIRSSANPYQLVAFDPLPRTPIASIGPCPPDPNPSPYCGLANPTPYAFDLQVDINQNDDLGLVDVTVQVYRTGSAAGVPPIVRLTTILDDQ